MAAALGDLHVSCAVSSPSDDCFSSGSLNKQIASKLHTNRNFAMFGKTGRPQFHGRREPTSTPSFNSGHRNFHQPPPSYRTPQAGYDEDDDEEEWDSSDEEVYENEPQAQTAPPPTTRRPERQPPPPGRPPYNHPNNHHPTRAPPPNYPPQRPFNNFGNQRRDSHAPPQPEPDEGGDDLYLPIDSAQEERAAPPLPSNFSRPQPGFNIPPAHKPGLVTPSRPSFPPPSSTGGRPPMPTPSSLSPSNDMGPAGDRPPRDWNTTPSRSRSSPRSSPGPPSRDNSGRSSGSRPLPHRGGSGGSRSSQDSAGSGERPNARPYLPPGQPDSPARTGGFESFKTGQTGFNRNFNAPGIPDKPNNALPGFSRPNPEKPSKPRLANGFNAIDRKPLPASKGRKPPVKEKPKVDVSSELEQMFHKNLPQPSEVSPDHTTANKPAARLPFFKKAPRPQTVEQQTWFKDLSRNEAQNMIGTRPRDGCFIVRPGRPPNPYSLTVYSGGFCNLVIRRRADSNFALGNEKANEKSFPTVIELIEYHMKNPLVLAEGKGEVVLVPV